MNVKNVKIDKNAIINVICTIISMFLTFFLFMDLSGFAITKSINKNLSNEKIEKVVDSIDLSKILEDASFYEEADDGSLMNQLDVKPEDLKQLLSRYKESGLTFGEELTIMLKEKLEPYTDTSEMKTLEDVTRYIKESGQFNLSEEDYNQNFEGNKLVGEDNEVINEILSTNYKGLMKIIKKYASQATSVAMVFTGTAVNNAIIFGGVVLILLLFAAQRSFVKAFPWIGASFVIASLTLLAVGSVFSATTAAFALFPSLLEASNQLFVPVSGDMMTFTIAYFIIAAALIALRIYLPNIIENNKKTL